MNIRSIESCLFFFYHMLNIFWLLDFSWFRSVVSLLSDMRKPFYRWNQVAIGQTVACQRGKDVEEFGMLSLRTRLNNKFRAFNRS